MALRDRRPKLAPQGRRRDYADIPKAVSDLVGDPFRSLAGELRLAGGYAKDTTPFSEFLWADFLRRRSARTPKRIFDAALEEVLKLASQIAPFTELAVFPAPLRELRLQLEPRARFDRSLSRCPRHRAGFRLIASNVPLGARRVQDG